VTIHRGIHAPSTTERSCEETRLTSEHLIGSGLTADVFSWERERVLKLFFAWVDPEAIRQELRVTQAVSNSGVPAPAAFELLRIGQRFGIVFERVSGDTLVRQVEKRPWQLFGAARQLAKLHAHIHTYAAPDELPLQQKQLEHWIEQAKDCSESQKQMAKERAAQLSTGRSLCHGDFHPGNILVSSRGPVIIDWAGATKGHPMADVARTSVLFEHASLPPTVALHVRFLMKVARGFLHSTYLRTYLALRQGDMKELEFWRFAQRIAGSGWQAKRDAAMARIERLRANDVLE